MAAVKRRASRRRRRSGGTSGWLWLTAGLAVGLAVAAALYLGSEPAQRTAPGSERARTPAPAAPARPAAPQVPAPADPEPERFQFYDMLPRFEVVVPERDPPRGAAPRPAPRTGQYVLQAGSFSRHADADRIRAQLALLGIGASIQRIVVDGTEYHRVLVGPLSDPAEIERVRSRLRQENMEVIERRIGD